MNDVIKRIQQGIINCDYLDMYCPCHICHIYEIWRSKDVGDALKSSFGGSNGSHNEGGGDFNGEGAGDSHYVMLVY